MYEGLSVSNGIFSPLTLLQLSLLHEPLHDMTIKGHVLHINIYPVITRLATMQWLTCPPMHS